MVDHASDQQSEEGPLTEEDLRGADAYWRAANYLSVGQIYLLDNPLLKEPLQRDHTKPRLLGHWGTTPGLNFIYAHMSRAIKTRDLNAIYVIGPGHGGPAAVANAWLEGTSRWTPKTVLDVLRNATYTGKLPFNGDLYQANHEPIIDEQPFERAQKLLEMRAESLPSRAANASNYLLTGLLQCARCGHGFIGTNAHGRGGVYRYYTCYSRQRHGTARCDQERIPAEPLEEAIVAEALAALDDGSIFLEAAKKADEARTVARSDEEAERRELSAEVASKREAIDRYLKAFETGKLPPSACGHRLEELHKEIEVFEKRSGVLEAELADTTTAFSDRDLVKLKHEIGAALLGAGPEQVKELLSVVVREIRVQCRSSIQPFFVAPGVRTPAPQRRRTGIEPAHRGSPGAPVLKTGRDTSPLSPPGDRGPIRPGAANSTGSAGGAAPNRRSGPRGPRLRAVPA